MSTIHVSQRVNRGAGLKQGFRNFNGIAWCFLAIIFHAIGCDVMKKRGAMHGWIAIGDPHRTRPNQFRIVAQ